jgi:hypothetical protein
VKVSSSGEESVSCDEEDNLSDDSGIQHDVCTKSVAERPRVAFTGKYGINTNSEDPNKTLADYSGLAL